MSNERFDLIYFDPRLQPEQSVKEVVYTGEENDCKLLRTTTKSREYQAVSIDFKVRSLVGLVEPDGRIRLVPSCVYYAQKQTDDTVSERVPLPDTEMSRAERSTLLIDSFGSARQKRVLHSRLLNQINSESLDTAVTYAKDSVDTSKIECYDSTKSDADSFLELLPRCNLEATRPEDVYLLSDIVSEEELNMLYDEANVLTAMSAQQLENTLKLSHWTYYRDHLLKRPADEKKCIRFCSLLTFHKLLMQLHHAGVRKINQKISLLIDAPSAIRERLFNEFVSTSVDERYGNAKRVITSRSKDRLLNHILILALFIDNFCINLNMFMKDLKLTKTKLTNAAESIGCKIKAVMEKSGTKQSTQWAMLQTPVRFPVIATKRRL